MNIGKTILIVEDQAETAEMFGEMLKLSGYQVQSTTKVQPAIAMIQRSPPDGIILDIMLPGVSGLEVLCFVRAQQDLADLPVIVVSAKSMPEDIEAGMEAGATAYLTKPVAFWDIKKTIEDALAA